jgi:hypothetical protein
VNGRQYRRTNAAHTRQEESMTMPDMALQDGVVIDARGLAFEMTGSAKDILGYLDGTVRSDLTDTDDSEYLDEAISALRQRRRGAR